MIDPFDHSPNDQFSAFCAAYFWSLREMISLHKYVTSFGVPKS